MIYSVLTKKKEKNSIFCEKYLEYHIHMQEKYKKFIGLRHKMVTPNTLLSHY